jgi:cytochrome c oxidase subunit 1
MFIAVPTGIKIFNWMGTLWGGSIDFKTPMLFALGFVTMFIIGGLSGVMHSISPSDAQQQDTYFIVAHIHYVLFGGSIFAVFAGIYYWFPKASGRILNEKIGQINFWLVFIGMNLTFFPMHFLGMDGMPRRQVTYESNMGWDLWNMVASIGALVLAAGILAFVHNFFWSLRKGEIAGDDPWDGRTLEWSISSPPPEYNFAVIPTVSGRDPFWETKMAAGGDQSVTQEPDVDPSSIHMPSPSYWPLVAAFGLGLAGYMLMYSYIGAAIATVITIAGIAGWSMEPATAPSEEH